MNAMSFQPVSLTALYTHHNDIDATQYVHTDVRSNYSCYRIFCDTHHSNMYVPQYVYVDVLLGYS